MTVTTRPAAPADLALIYAFIRELAVYEKLDHEVEASEADIGALLFADHPTAFCDIAEADGQPVGFALWFYSVSTFVGRKGIWLEDLFVRESARGQGAGLALLKGLAKRAVAEDLGRVEWAVLDWNAPSIAFYDQLGADALDDWTTRRLSGQALEMLGS